MEVTDSVPREQQDTCKKILLFSHEDFWHGSRTPLNLQALSRPTKAVARRSPEHCNASSADFVARRTELDLGSIDRVALSAGLRKLASALHPQFFEMHLKPSRRHGTS
jgi:hypothetical protein